MVVYLRMGEGGEDERAVVKIRGEGVRMRVVMVRWREM